MDLCYLTSIHPGPFSEHKGGGQDKYTTATTHQHLRGLVIRYPRYQFQPTNRPLQDMWLADFKHWTGPTNLVTRLMIGQCLRDKQTGYNLHNSRQFCKEIGTPGNDWVGGGRTNTVTSKE